MINKFIEYVFMKLNNWFLCKAKFRDKTVKFIPVYVRQIIISYLAHRDAVAINFLLDKNTFEIKKSKFGDLLLKDTHIHFSK